MATAAAAGPSGARGTGAKGGPVSRAVKCGASAAPAAAQFGGDRSLDIVRREVFEASAFGRQLLVDIHDAEDVLVGGDEVEHLLLRRLRLGGALQRLDQVGFDRAEVDRLLGDLAQRD